jgi:hypothetical protein
MEVKRKKKKKSETKLLANMAMTKDNLIMQREL